MKKLLVSLLCSIYTFTLFSLDHHPITIVIHNKVNQELVISIEYQLDQHYTRNNSKGTPFVPNNNQFHYLNTLAPNFKKTISVFAFHPCTQQFCNLHHNLQLYGFEEYYKVIQGSVTVQERNRSYDFKLAVFNGSIITININEYGITTHATEQLNAMQTCYDSGICIA